MSARVARLGVDVAGGILAGVLVYFFVDVVAADWLHRTDGLMRPPWSALVGAAVLFGALVGIAWVRPRLALVAALTMVVLAVAGLVIYDSSDLVNFEPLAFEPRSLLVFGAQEPVTIASVALLSAIALQRRDSWAR
ncbi:MAG: hypothetical protein JOZ82_05910 [Marmoricola sp.]|nr:hypothetical protein [Marmoricola sp.]